MACSFIVHSYFEHILTLQIYNFKDNIDWLMCNLQSPYMPQNGKSFKKYWRVHMHMRDV